MNFKSQQKKSTKQKNCIKIKLEIRIKYFKANCKNKPLNTLKYRQQLAVCKKYKGFYRYF